MPEAPTFTQATPANYPQPGNQGLSYQMTGFQLSDTSVSKNVPFIWVSDHDPDAWTMYKTLKYGSMATPYLSPSLCISRLEWGGITKAQFTNVVKIAKEQKFRELKRQNRDWSVAKAEIEADKWAPQRLNGLPTTQQASYNQGYATGNIGER